jgi:chromosome segregation ATPase
VLDEVADDVTRTRLWLQTDRQAHWQQQIRRRTHELEQRQQELFSARISSLIEASPAMQHAVQKARQAIREGEEKLHRVRQWLRQYDQRVEPVGRQVDKLRHYFDHDLVMAVAFLDEMINTLGAYAELSPAGSIKTAPLAETDAGAAQTEKPASTNGSPTP